MTSPSRRKRPTTVRRSQVRATPKWQIAAWLALGVAGSALHPHRECLGQEPKWSPQPFHPQAAVSRDHGDPPANASQAAEPTATAPVQRWRKAESTSRPSKLERSSSLALAEETRSTPRGIAPTRTPSVEPTREIARASHTELRLQPAGPSAPGHEPAAEHATETSERLAEPTASSRKTVVAAQWTNRDEPIAEPPSEMPPVRLATPPSRREKLVVQEPVAPPSPPAIPNPFPSAKGDIPSPSDRILPPESPNSALDLPPVPPIRAERSAVNCEAVRDFVDRMDIRSVRVDSSPSFVQGYPTRDRSLTNTKENFVAESPRRVWYSNSGEELARGKLVDLVKGNAIIENEEGTRTTILLRKLSDPDQVFVAEAWGVPVTCSLVDEEVEQRMFADSILTWKASGICYKPLYFQDVQLERYGHEWGPVVQPALSTVRFFGDLAVLPYKMGIHPPNECQYPLGYYRPGECAPWTHGPVPISLRGALFQSAFVTGTAWALP